MRLGEVVPLQNVKPRLGFDGGSTPDQEKGLNVQRKLVEIQTYLTS